MKKKNTLRERFQYWFDEQMAKGTGSMVRILAVSSIAFIVLIALIIFLVCINDDLSFGEALWDSFATTVNAWMPYSDEGSLVYRLFITIAAIIGLFFTSVLIGIVSTYMEEKINSLRKGVSRVLETGHVVVLGFHPGEFTLLQQLIDAAAGEKRCIVVAEDMEKDELEDLLRENLSFESNIKLICRTADITDPSSLACCSLPDSSVIVVNAKEDSRTVKAILAARSVLAEAGSENQIPIISSVNDSRYLLPRHAFEDHNIVMLQTGDMVARIIAHSATQTGLSRAFTEVFNFTGSEFYIRSFKELIGSSFKKICDAARGGVPVGIIRGKQNILVPLPDEIYQENDRLFYFAEGRSRLTFDLTTDVIDHSIQIDLIHKPEGNVLILGENENLPLVVSELSTHRNGLDIIEDPDSADIDAYLSSADHIILLSRHLEDREENDMNNMLRLLQLRDYKARSKRQFSLTVEMLDEKNRSLVARNDDDASEFIVASDVSAMIQAQLAENVELYRIFRELLSNEGCEFKIRRAAFADGRSAASISDIRHSLIKKEYILLGYIDRSGDKTAIRLNPAETDMLTLNDDIGLIVIGR